MEVTRIEPCRYTHFHMPSCKYDIANNYLRRTLCIKCRWYIIKDGHGSASFD
uniref:Uncharacterized protein n=1 Tax=Anguilla anguilla TaxID=7936 RepID=A0A0E9PPJ5_ANGAN